MARRRHSKGPSQRQLRAGELIRHALVDIFAREEFQDPALAGVSITISEVRTSPDLRHANVFCAPLGGKGQADMVAALNKASGYIRGRLGREIDMKFTPSLKFTSDDSFDSATSLDRLLARPEVARDLVDRSEEE